MKMYVYLLIYLLCTNHSVLASVETLSEETVRAEIDEAAVAWEVSDALPYDESLALAPNDYTVPVYGECHDWLPDPGDGHVVDPVKYSSTGDEEEDARNRRLRGDRLLVPTPAPSHVPVLVPVPNRRLCPASAKADCQEDWRWKNTKSEHRCADNQYFGNPGSTPPGAETNCRYYERSEVRYDNRCGRWGDFYGCQCYACPTGKKASKTYTHGGTRYSYSYLSDCVDKCGKGQKFVSPFCLPCPNYEYSNTDNSNYCSKCEWGKQANSDRTDCETCGPGKYRPSRDTADACTFCPEGKKHQSGRTGCDSCPVGKYTSSSGQSSCTSCPTGKYGKSGGFKRNSEGNACAWIPAGKERVPSDISETSECREGYYRPANEVSNTCTVCPEPEYQINPGQSSCVSPGIGYYRKSISSRARCAAGKYGGNAMSCTRVKNGYYPCVEVADSNSYSTNLFTATTGAGARYQCQCPAGKYSYSDDNTHGPTSCSTSAEGKYSSNGSGKAGSTSAKNCENGRYQPSSNQSTCIDCEKGKARTGNEQARTKCNLCSTGRYQGSTKQSTCLICEADTGTYAPIVPGTAGTGNLNCTNCTYGKYQADGKAEQGFCQNCEVGKWLPYHDGTTNSDSSKCEICPVGRFSGFKEGNPTTYINADYGTQDDRFDEFAGKAVNTILERINNNQCDFTNKGDHSKHEFQDGDYCRCPFCPATHTNHEPGSAGCEPCEAGTAPARNDDGESLGGCRNCPKGYFAAEASAVCELCPNGQVTLAAKSASCTVCAAGKTSNDDRTECIPCAIGKYRSASMELCEPCQAGHISVDSRVSCLSCPPGQSTDGDDRTECKVCGPGKYKEPEGEGGCQECATGKYSGATEEGNDLCKRCDAGAVTNLTLTGTGSSSCKDCAPGKYSNNFSNPSTLCLECSEGYYSDTKSTECSPCSGGKYQGGKGGQGEGSCLECVKGKFSTDGSSECTECLAGTFGNARGMPECETCPAGKFSPSGASSCEPCEGGYYSTQPGSPECVKADAGYYVDKNSDRSEQIACPVGTYTDNVGQTECNTCTAGKMSQDSAASQGCDVCPAGTFSEAGAGECTQCPDGTVTTAPEQGGCVICSDGKYMSPDRTKCIPCKSGTYQGDDKQTECYDCPKGKFSVNNNDSEVEKGPLSCTACDAGKFQGSTGAAKCVECPVNSYQGEEGQSSCIPCPEGMRTDHDNQEACFYHPTSQPSSQPTSYPSSAPTGQPTSNPSSAPTSYPTSYSEFLTKKDPFASLGGGTSGNFVRYGAMVMGACCFLIIVCVWRRSRKHKKSSEFDHMDAFNKWVSNEDKKFAAGVKPISIDDIKTANRSSAAVDHAEIHNTDHPGGISSNNDGFDYDGIDYDSTAHNPMLDEFIPLGAKK